MTTVMIPDSVDFSLPKTWESFIKGASLPGSLYKLKQVIFNQRVSALGSW